MKKNCFTCKNRTQAEVPQCKSYVCLVSNKPILLSNDACESHEESSDHKFALGLLGKVVNELKQSLEEDNS